MADASWNTVFNFEPAEFWKDRIMMRWGVKAGYVDDGRARSQWGYGGAMWPGWYLWRCVCFICNCMVMM